MASQAKLSRIAIEHVLFATDFSPESDNALHCATCFARRYGATLTLAHILTREPAITMGDSWPVVEDVLREKAEKLMARLEQADEVRTVCHDTIIVKGNAGEGILRTAHEQNIDLIVMATHGYEGVKKLFLGSTAEEVLRHATCPVLTVGPHARLITPERLRHVFYATDFSSGSARALTYALSLAENDRSELTLLHVIEGKPISEDELFDWRFHDRERLACMVPHDVDMAYKPEIEVETGVAHHQILLMAETRGVDLIVMGSHFAGPLSTHLPWTTLHRVLEGAHCPVLTVCGP
jgi:nucleotide-binding universal stress UspA family protein